MAGIVILVLAVAAVLTALGIWHGRQMYLIGFKHGRACSSKSPGEEPVKIRTCHDCPFSSATLMSLLTVRDEGHCRYDAERDQLALSPAGMREGPERELAISSFRRQVKIPNIHGAPPPTCPLRKEGMTLSLEAASDEVVS